jgi:hypothetical protein
MQEKIRKAAVTLPRSFKFIDHHTPVMLLHQGMTFALTTHVIDKIVSQLEYRVIPISTHHRADELHRGRNWDTEI